jgi:hypothetical protein
MTAQKSTPKPTSETSVPIVLMNLRDVQKTCNKVWDADPVAAPMTPNPAGAGGAAGRSAQD